MMAIFKGLLRKPHRSDSWIPTESLELVLDLTKQSVCNVGLGQPIEWLSVLGPPEDSRAVHEECYCYYSKGIEVDADKDLVSGIVVVWFDDLRKNFSAFQGQVKYQDHLLDVSPDFTEESFVRVFGKPYHRDEDEEEILLFYEIRPDVEWQVEFSKQNSLKALIMTTEPLLSNKSQREAYAVKKPWPPEYK